MKTTFLTSALAFVFLSSTCAADAVLQYGLDFNERQSQAGIIFTNKGEGTTTVQRSYGTTGGNYIGTNDGNAGSITTPVGDKGYAFKTSGQVYYTIGTGSSPLDGLNIADGISLGVHLYQQEASVAGKDALTLTFGTDSSAVTFDLEMVGSSWSLQGAGDDFMVQTQGSTLTLSDVMLTSPGANTWCHLGLTFTENSITVYADGVFQKKLQLTQSLGELTKIGGVDTTERPEYPNSIYVDNLAVYSGQLNAASYATLATNPMPASFNVPEPSTATLSLLALAGLAARRRRK